MLHNIVTRTATSVCIEARGRQGEWAPRVGGPASRCALNRGGFDGGASRRGTGEVTQMSGAGSFFTLRSWAVLVVDLRTPVPFMPLARSRRLRASFSAVIVHDLLWWLDGGDRRLSRRARSVIADEGNSVLVSAASAWEIATKVRLGKLPGAIEVAAELPAILRQQHFEPLPIAIVHALRVGHLPGRHRDPFDRLLIAQAQDENLALVRLRRVWHSAGLVTRRPTKVVREGPTDVASRTAAAPRQPGTTASRAGSAGDRAGRTRGGYLAGAARVRARPD